MRCPLCRRRFIRHRVSCTRCWAALDPAGRTAVVTGWLHRHVDPAGWAEVVGAASSRSGPVAG